MADSEPGREVARSELRASHEDRDRVVELLRVSAGDGRLTAEELDERLELAMTARTYGELAKLVADLPADGSVAIGCPRAKDVVRLDCGSGHTVRNGQWIVPQRIEARVRSGHLKLDFSQAVITHPSLQLDAEVRSGHIILITKPGIVVDTRRGGPQRPRSGPRPVGSRRTRGAADRGLGQGRQRPFHRAPAVPDGLAVADQAAEAVRTRRAEAKA